MNSINLVGNLVADPEVREYQPGKSMCKFRIGVKRPFRSDITDFFSIVAFGKTAETIGQYFHKGDFIGVTGAMHTNSYQDKNGNNRTSYEVMVDRFCFAGQRNQPKRRQEEPVDFVDEDFFMIDEDDPLPF